MRLFRRRNCLRATHILCALLLCAVTVNSLRLSAAEDNVGRFPTPEETEPARFTEPEPVVIPSSVVEQADATYPLPPPMPTVSPNPPPNPYQPNPIYGWPGSEPDVMRHPHTYDLHLAAGRRLFGEDFARHSDPDDPARHIGYGQPLHGTSWRNRPYYSALLVGSMIADDLRGNVELHNDLFVGVHQGWDFDHYYGAECRLAGGVYDVYDSPPGVTDDIVFADAHLLYYPWGDSLWRPYYSIGLGLAFHHARINNTRVYDETLVHIPLGIGLKYQWKRHCAMRFDIKHNISFGGGGLHGMDHVSLSYGFEYHYGGRRKSYFPWSPSIHLK